MMSQKASDRRLIIILGPTAVGKTDYSISLAQKYASPIISCDSRQIYKEMRIGTAVPDAAQLSAVQHYFIQNKSVSEYYTAGLYELDALKLIEDLFNEGHDTLIMSGGSMFYIDAVCNGMAEVPCANMELRENLSAELKKVGAQALSERLRELDPVTYETIDRSNGMRVLRALEVCLDTGKPFSSFKVQAPKKRNFTIEKIGLRRSREELYSRIDSRVIKMVDEGLIEEVRSLNEFRNLTALQTVGYKEVFNYLDNLISLEQTITSIQQNTRHYAKRQMTWWKRDASIKWLDL